MIEKFRELVKNRHEYAKDWKKRTGKKVIGFICPFGTEELIYAAGALPVRILSSREPPTLAEPYLVSFSCPFSRGCFHDVLKKEYDYLDGVVLNYTCTHLFAVYDAWRRWAPPEFNAWVYHPKTVDRSSAKPEFVEELKLFKASLEGFIGAPISAEAARKAIEVYNEDRRLMHEVYDLRKNDPPPISGAEALEMVLSSMLIRKEEHVALVRESLAKIAMRKDGPKSATRLLITGSDLHNADILRLIEGLGANVVSDDLCTGMRYLGEINLGDSDPLSAIADNYLKTTNCPCKIPDRRFEDIPKQAKDYNVQGILMVQQKFCNPHASTLPRLKERLKKSNIPSLFLEMDTTIPEGQYRTRTEAFLEMLQEDTL